MLPFARQIILRRPAWVLAGADLDFDFARGLYYRRGIGVRSGIAMVSVSRASSGTDLLPTSASGFGYTTFGSAVARRTNLGLLVEEARTNNLLNSAVPATQTTASLATGTYTLWVNGSGSATSSAGTAVGSGFGAATQGTPNVITLTGAGTVVVTVAGSLNAFQLELGAFGTSLIVTAGATATRAADVVTVTIPPAFGSSYTLVGKGTPHALESYGTDQVLAQLDDGTANNRTSIRRLSTNGNGFFSHTAAGVLTSENTNTAWSTNVSLKLAGTMAASNQAVVLNGGAPATGANALPATPTNIRIGSIQSGIALWNGYIERIALKLFRDPNANLIRDTAP